MSPADLVAHFRAARADPSRAVLEGFHAVKHAIRFGAAIELVATSDRAALLALAARLAPDVRLALDEVALPVAATLFAELTPTPPETGIIAIAKRRIIRPDELALLPIAAPVVLLEAPSHAGNIGAVVRVAAGAGAAAVVTTGPNDPWQPAALRGSAGLHYALPVARVESAEFIGRHLIAVDPEGTAFDGHTIPSNAVLAFGSERSGLSQDILARANSRLRIPMEPGVSSLNLATAVAVVLYGWRLGRNRPT